MRTSRAPPVFALALLFCAIKYYRRGPCSVLSTPRVDNRFPLDNLYLVCFKANLLAMLYCLAHVALGLEPCSLPDIGHVSWVGSALRTDR